MTTMPRRLLPVVAAVALVATTLAPTCEVRAETADITIENGTPTAVFPDGITFPVTATSDEEITDVELFYRPQFRETWSLSTPAIDPATEITLDHDIDLRAGQLPVGVDIEYRWQMTQADGDVIQSEIASVPWVDTRFDWETISSPKINVSAYNGNPEFNAKVLASADATVTDLESRLGFTIEHPIDIWVYSNGTDFDGALAPNSEPWIAGAAYSNLGLIQAVIPTGDVEEMERVVPHEVSHQVLYQATQNPFNGPPSWFDEGLATTAEIKVPREYWARVRAAAEDGRLDDIASLNGQFPYDTDLALLAYAESFSIVTYIIETYGEEGLVNLIAAFGEGISVEDAVQQGLGISLDDLNTAWQAQAGEQAQNQLNAVAGGMIPFDDFPAGGTLLASGTLVIGLAVITSLILGRRNRRDDEDTDEEAWSGPHGRLGDAWDPSAI